MGERQSPTNGKPEWVMEIQDSLSRMTPLPLRTKKKEIPMWSNRRRRLYGMPESVMAKHEYDDVHLPERVSLGPYLADLDRRKDLKEASFLHVLRRSQLENPLDRYLEAMTSIVDELREANDGLDQRWRDDTQAFLRMMLHDGSFLLEFLRMRRRPDPDNPIIRHVLEDPEEVKCYVHDFLLLGNQLPLWFLQKLIAVDPVNPNFSEDDYINMLLSDIAYTILPKNHVHDIRKMYTSMHILDMYRLRLVQYECFLSRKNRKKRSQVGLHSKNIPSATDLFKAGIGFTTSGSINLFDMSLQRKTLELPEINVGGSTRLLFYNLLAYEQLHKDAMYNVIKSYMYFMGCLVQTAEDASLLQSRGIIVTVLPSADVARLFNKMAKDISLDSDDSLASEFKIMVNSLRALYNKMSNEWRIDLFQTYLKSPWAIMSLIAGIILLILSFIQTIYTVLGYVRPK